jgi:hypothetical protein
MKRIAALKEIFSELDKVVAGNTAAPRSEELCFAKV